MNGNAKNILLVEDEALIALAEKKRLEERGFAVHHVFTGEEAVRAVAAGSPPIDLVLMDINLGAGIDGTEAARRILAQREIPVVFLSSHTEPEVVEKTETITSYGYAVKDTGITVLVASIGMALKLFREKMERARAEAALRATERRFEQLIQNSYDTIVVLDAEGIQRYVSPSAERVHGFRPDELVDIPVIETMIHPDDRERVLAAFRQILAEGEGGVRYRHRRKAGGWVELEARAVNRLDNPDIQGVIVNVRDLTGLAPDDRAG